MWQSDHIHRHRHRHRHIAPIPFVNAVRLPFSATLLFSAIYPINKTINNVMSCEWERMGYVIDLSTIHVNENYEKNKKPQ